MAHAVCSCSSVQTLLSRVTFLLWPGPFPMDLYLTKVGLIHPGHHQCYQSSQHHDSFTVSYKSERKALTPAMYLHMGGAPQHDSLGLELLQGLLQQLSVYTPSSYPSRNEQMPSGSRDGRNSYPDTMLHVLGMSVPLWTAGRPCHWVWLART